MFYPLCPQYPEPCFINIPDVEKIFRSCTYLMREAHNLKEDYYFFLLKVKVATYVALSYVYMYTYSSMKCIVKGTVRWYVSRLSAINITSLQENNDDELRNKCLLCIKIKMVCLSWSWAKASFPPKNSNVCKCLLYSKGYLLYLGLFSIKGLSNVTFST